MQKNAAQSAWGWVTYDMVEPHGLGGRPHLCKLKGEWLMIR